MKKELEAKELDKVTGGLIVGGKGGAGTVASQSDDSQMLRMECPYCHDIFRADVSKPSVKCPTCHRIIEIKG